ncbi:hypothetical protein K6U06_19660 [Acidiferrimicrobium sp. IK]|uniref:hypothetical protein n=1 Tax=Acidiferrimicrobium sp. IK TaxID=2871700 RepID=UPI0021CB981C|nr:hypothetical protein [Acidiferrimicrobium sp. IK]MCU4186591.1 hypothetical protein [Acidiferrimicrobium sp. IK]
MAGDRTLVTELATALGTLPYPDLPTVLAARPGELTIDDGVWDRLQQLHQAGAHAEDFATAWSNGRAFAAAGDGLAGRPPRLVEWTGGRRPPGDEVAPIDLRIDHVYLISCKYLSDVIANPSPGRLFDGLLATAGEWDRGDWYQAVAPEEYQALYAACRDAAGLPGLPDAAGGLTGEDRLRLSRALADRLYPPGAREAYRQLCVAVSERSAERWARRLAASDPERALWRLLRIGNAPYFLLGAKQRAGRGRGPGPRNESLRLRVATPWDWRQAHRLEELQVRAAGAGQPRVDWTARCTDLRNGAARQVDGHVEIRWSHGRFRQPPEAKVYLDTPASRLPGYHSLDAPAPPGQLPL